MKFLKLKEGFSGAPFDVIGGKKSAVFIFLMLLAIGFILSLLGFVKLSRAAYSALMITLGYLISIIAYKPLKDWFSPLILSSGVIVGLFLFIPEDMFLGIFLYALGFGLGVSVEENKD